MTGLPNDSTAAQRADLALEIAQHPHLKLCDICAIELAEISGNTSDDWSRALLNELAHRCIESARVHAELSDQRDLLNTIALQARHRSEGDE